MFLTIFRRFPTIFRRFPKICKMFTPKVVHMFPNIFRTFPKISEDIQRLPKITKEHTKMFRPNIDLLWFIQHWNRANLSGNIRNRYLHMWNNVLFSRVKIWFLRAKDFLVFHWCLYNKRHFYPWLEPENFNLSQFYIHTIRTVRNPFEPP